MPSSRRQISTTAGGICRRQREIRIGCLRASDEQFDGAALRAFAAPSASGTASGADAVDVLLGRLERFLARDENAHARVRGTRSVSTSGATASDRCSQLSSTSSIVAARGATQAPRRRTIGRRAARRAHAPPPPAPARRRLSAASSTHHTPSGYSAGVDCRPPSQPPARRVSCRCRPAPTIVTTRMLAQQGLDRRHVAGAPVKRGQAAGRFVPGRAAARPTRRRALDGAASGGARQRRSTGSSKR